MMIINKNLFKKLFWFKWLNSSIKRNVVMGIVRLSEPLELTDSAKVIAIEQIVMAIMVSKMSKSIKIKPDTNVIKIRVAVNITTEPSIDFISPAILYLCVSFLLLPTNEAKGSATAKIIYEAAIWYE